MISEFLCHSESYHFKKKSMKKITLTSTSCPVKYLYGFILLLCFSIQGFSQSVSISATGTPPNANAGLDINTPTKGLLIPRVALLAAGNFAPLPSHIAGMMVYNTATVADVSPGLFYNDGTKWVAYLPPAGTALNDMQYWNGTAWVNLHVGLPGQKLTVTAGGIPAWGN